MVSVRSTVLGKFQFAAGGNFLIAHGQPGQTIILRTFQLWTSNSSGVGASIYIQDTDVSGLSVLLGRFALTTDTPAAWDSWLVMNQNSQLVLATSGGPTYAWVSGMLLSGVSSYIPPSNPVVLPATLEPPPA